ncbi:MAG: hypothetical protein NTU90_01905 [Proteobacteria bacterium]|nr:hypothetical protein [Pseudomonadota bacterium]
MRKMCALEFIKGAHEELKSDGTTRFSPPTIRSMVSVIAKLCKFCHDIPSLKNACPQLEDLVSKWEKNMQVETKKASVFSELDLLAIYSLPDTAENMVDKVRQIKFFLSSFDFYIEGLCKLRNGFVISLSIIICLNRLLLLCLLPVL